MELNVPTGTPLVYELDKNFGVVSQRYLGDPEEIAKAQAAVANQGKQKNSLGLKRYLRFPSQSSGATCYS